MNDKLKTTIIILFLGSILFIGFIMFTMHGLKKYSENAKTGRSALLAYEKSMQGYLNKHGSLERMGEIKDLPVAAFNVALPEAIAPSAEDAVPAAAGPERWPDFVSMTTLHFIIYGYNQEMMSFVASRIESYYSGLVEDTGLYEAYAPTSQLKAYIFRNKEEYLKYTGMPEWSTGCASNGVIYTYETPQIHFIVPHELAHLMFDYFLGSDKDYSKIRCIYEGMAVYLEMKSNPDYRRYILAKVNDSVKRSNSPHHIALEKLPNTELLSGSDSELIGAWYSQCGALVDFLIHSGGKSKFYSFANGLKTYMDVDSALNYGYPGEYSSLESMKPAWTQYLSENSKI